MTVRDRYYLTLGTDGDITGAYATLEPALLALYDALEQGAQRTLIATVPAMRALAPDVGGTLSAPLMRLETVKQFFIECVALANEPRGHRREDLVAIDRFGRVCHFGREYGSAPNADAFPVHVYQVRVRGAEELAAERLQVTTEDLAQDLRDALLSMAGAIDRGLCEPSASRERQVACGQLLRAFFAAVQRDRSESEGC